MIFLLFFRLLACVAWCRVLIFVCLVFVSFSGFCLSVSGLFLIVSLFLFFLSFCLLKICIDLCFEV